MGQSIFKPTMTSSEARKILFTVVEGISPEEREAINREYAKVVPIIVKREFEENDGWCTSDPLD